MKTESEALLELARVIYVCGSSPNVSDSNGEPANLVDVIQNVATGLHRIADAIEALKGDSDAGGKE